MPSSQIGPSSPHLFHFRMWDVAPFKAIMVIDPLRWTYGYLITEDVKRQSRFLREASVPGVFLALLFPPDLRKAMIARARGRLCDTSDECNTWVQCMPSPRQKVVSTCIRTLTRIVHACTRTRVGHVYGHVHVLFPCVCAHVHCIVPKRTCARSCTHVSMCACQPSACACVPVHVCLSRLAHARAGVHACIRVCAPACIRACSQACVHTGAHAGVHRCTGVGTCVSTCACHVLVCTREYSACVSILYVSVQGVRACVQHTRAYTHERICVSTTRASVRVHACAHPRECA